ncbi:coenzyme PQQ precursor peptide PqqA [Limimonas halophila]|uniref:Coenzyme PQQ synthesis protein A n=1 Tax=Limimonas halophila TaxID=1082479 RepID=A0A1G7RIP8_9PROT|nr:pyrroloquinoline quinone precursor peptide PqqA [Limimonas halophila]SDG10535.1 coenzyme PQQ precursor peptide PqqA [Limimonas halophila]
MTAQRESIPTPPPAKTWTAPTVREIPAGMEINAYICAERDR